MTHNHILEDWLNEASPGGEPDGPAGQSSSSDGMAGSLAPANIGGQDSPTVDPNIGNVDQTQQAGNPEPEDVSEDPVSPEMPEEKDSKDFESLKREYFKESIKGETGILMDLLNSVRDNDHLLPVQRKFVEDNFQVQLIRQNSNIDKASKDIRRNIKDQLDKNNPSTTVVNHMVSVLDTIPTLNNIFIKMKGYGGLKSDLHRKYIAALLGAVQVGSGANTEDIIYNEKEYSILISTRFNSELGEVALGQWSMKEDDPERYLTDPELKRLRDGAPDEKAVLRKRVVLEAIAKQFETRAFIVNMVDEDGTIYFLGWDVASSLRGAYTEGKLIVKLTNADDSEAFISEEGEIVPYMNLDIYYGKETGEQKEDGTPEVDELPFIERKNGTLFLTADIKTIKEASDSMQGLVFKTMPYSGNPSDLKVLSRCVFSVSDLVLKQC